MIQVLDHLFPVLYSDDKYKQPLEYNLSFPVQETESVLRDE